MEVGKVFSILSAIVVVAGITAVVTNPNSAGDIKAFGDTFSGALRASLGH